MYKIFLQLIFLAVSGCASYTPPPNFSYKEIETRNFQLASWQKITQPNSVYKIYIEGDGNAFGANGKVTANPTPRGTLMREMAFGDPSPNVIYLARPCQFIKSDICAPRHWSSARFAPEVIISTHQAISQIAGDQEIILIGYSGGAQVAGLIAAAKPGLKIKKIITVAGNLDHLAWTKYHKLPDLNESMNLESYRQQFLQIPQINYVGENDKIIPPFLTKNFVGDDNLVIMVPNATHDKGWQAI